MSLNNIVRQLSVFWPLVTLVESAVLTTLTMFLRWYLVGISFR